MADQPRGHERVSSPAGGAGGGAPHRLVGSPALAPGQSHGAHLGSRVATNRFARRAFLSLSCRWVGLRLLVGLFCLVGHAARGADTGVSKENLVKAGFLYNFTKYVEWPSARFADDTSPIIIGVLGRNPFGRELEQIVQTRTVNGRAIQVRLIHTAEEVLTVHLLFVPAGEETRLPAIAWQNAAVVVVGESADFTALGGTITFTRAEDKVQFAVNLEAAERVGLKISAQLLKLATAVRRKS